MTHPSAEPLGYRSALSLAGAIRARELSPLEAVDACLARADAVDPKLNALVWRNDEEARALAKAAGEQLARSGPELELPAFFGVPLPVKDLTAVAGWPVTYGSCAAPSGPSEESELVVDAFRRAGCILTGRTNVPELGPLPVSENLRYGATRNPWDLSLTAGGSSGGAAAAVAAGMFPLAHANDGGGSTRIPASCCGVVGLKASRGRVPSRQLAWEGAVVHGAVTRDVADAAAVLDAICGPDLGQWYNAPAPERPFLAEVGADPGLLRVAVWVEAPLGLPVSSSCVEAAYEAGRALEALGHAVDEVSLEVAEEFVNAFLTVANADFGDFEGVIDWERVEPHIRVFRAAGQAVDSLTYARSVHVLQRLSRQIVARWGRDFDILVTPTMTVEPPAAGAVLQAAHAAAATGAPVLEVFQMTAFTAGFNVTGQPAISLPTHMSLGGVPIGVQLVGGPWGEALLLRVAAQLEQVLPWRDRRPVL
jgi:amidase